MQITYQIKFTPSQFTHIPLFSRIIHLRDARVYYIYINISFVKNFICFYNVFLYLKHFFYQMQFCPHFLLVFIKMLKCSLIYHRTGQK